MSAAPNAVLGSIVRRLSDRYLHNLVASPAGLAFFLRYLAGLEQDEIDLFEQLAARAPDERFQKLIRTHREDEARHFELLERCAMSIGPRPILAPIELNPAYRFDQVLCGLAQSFLDGTGEVWEVYSWLQVLEERAVREYPSFARAVATVDTESAEVIRTIIEDERRHVLYAHAVGRKYAPSPAAHQRMLACYRSVEAQVFEVQQRAFLRFLLDEGLLELHRAEAMILRAACPRAPFEPAVPNRSPALELG
jgi:rubrerythrin